MALISKVGRRSLKVRAVVALLYLVLTLGAVTVVYPLLIMLAGSTGSAADSATPSPYPRFWFDDVVLYRKYVETKYNGDPGFIESRYRIKWESYEKLMPPKDTTDAYLADFLEWRPQCPWWNLGFVRPSTILPSNARLLRNQLYEKYHGDINAFRAELKLPYKHWNHVYVPYPNPTRTDEPETPFFLACKRFAQTRPADERIITNLDGIFWKYYLAPKYPNIKEYNQAHATNYKRIADIFLAADVPEQANALERKEWEDFVRHSPQMRLQFLRIDAGVAPQFHQFLSQTYDTIETYNAKFKSAFPSFNQVPFPTSIPDLQLAQVDWDRFIHHADLCPAEAIHVYGSRQSFEDFVAKKHAIPRDKVGPLNLPIAQADLLDMQAHAYDLRWEFTTRNYKDALGFIALHGNGVLNTLIFCGLAIVTHLLVNPLAAYALSRFKLPSTYTILLFCMATMAFPGEVTMIPRFLLLKSFPLWTLFAGTAAFAFALYLLTRLVPRSHELLRLFLALAIGVAVGSWLVPSVLAENHISLLNTFAALILPGMANGFSIFLLKGFFDSLPQELYEAADLDGASEWMKFWMITMGLSKPILAVIGLGAFTGAYAQFMMALIIIPDQKMWTIMVWLYQFQLISHQSVQYAALVLAAIPTLLVFIFCQNLIIRGIVVPVEK
jgi:ABC-type glycerol-3-phosphate transport system permease component